MTPEPATRDIVEHYIIARFRADEDSWKHCTTYIQEGDPFLKHLDNNARNDLTKEHIKYLIDEVLLIDSADKMQRLVAVLRVSQSEQNTLNAERLHELAIKTAKRNLQGGPISWPRVIRWFRAMGRIVSYALIDLGPAAVRCLTTILISMFQSYVILPDYTLEKRIVQLGGWNELLKLASKKGVPGPSATSTSADVGPKKGEALEEVSATSKSAPTTSAAKVVADPRTDTSIKTTPAAKAITDTRTDTSTKTTPAVKTVADSKTGASTAATTTPAVKRKLQTSAGAAAKASAATTSVLSAPQAKSAGEKLKAKLMTQKLRSTKCKCGAEKPRPTLHTPKYVSCRSCGVYLCMQKMCSKGFDYHSDILEHVEEHRDFVWVYRNPKVECVCNYPKKRVAGIPFTICDNDICCRYICNDSNECDKDFTFFDDLAKHCTKDHPRRKE